MTESAKILERLIPAYDPDLADATVRTEYWGGRSAETLAADLPVVPFDAPGLPPLPPNFVAFATSVGDPAPAAPPKGRKKPVLAPGPRLHALVRSALYRDTQLPVPTAGAGLAWVNTLPGQLIGATDRVGPDPAPLYVVGKCLGPAEHDKRRPFVGPGSEPLWEAWREAGLSPPEGWAYATNLVRFLPPRDAAQGALPASWVKDGQFLLFQELLLGRPPWLLVLGADALKALFGKGTTLESCRGLVRELTLDTRRHRPPEGGPPGPGETHTIRVVCADHPAAVAREPEKHPLLVSALRLLADRAAGDIPVETQARVVVPKITHDYRPVYTLAELRAEAVKSAEAARNGGYLAFDCEWHGRDPGDPGAFLYTVQWSHAPGHGRCVFVRRCGGVDNPDLPQAEAAQALSWLFGCAAARGTRLVTYFGKGDLKWLRAYGVDLWPTFEAQPATPEETYHSGAFDAFVGVTAVDETGPRKLEIVCNTRLGMERWDPDKDEETVRVCDEVLKCKPGDLPGYGFHSESVIEAYSIGDVDATGRLYLHLNGDPRVGTRGQLDADRFGNASRRVFHLRMRGLPAWAEMEATGFLVDADRHKYLRERFAAKRDDLLAELRREVNWPTLDLAKPNQRIELLYGECHHDKGRLRPPDDDPAGPGLTFGLTPYKATEAAGHKLWAEAVALHQAGHGPKPRVSTDKEAVADARAQHPAADLVYKIDGLTTALKSLLKPPEARDESDEPEEAEPATPPPPAPRRRRKAATPADPAELARGYDPDADEVYTKGLMKYVSADGRVRSLFGMTETGRPTSAKPNLFNVGGDTAAEKYDYIFRGEDLPPVRTMFLAPPGWLVLSADLKLAEVVVAAWYSDDPLLNEHAALANAGKMDLHADLAVRSFRLTVPDRVLTDRECVKYEVPPGTTVAAALGCRVGDPLPPNKKALAMAQKGHLRTASKRTRFGHYYGAQAETLRRKILEEPDARSVTLADVEELIRGHDAAYPRLAELLAAARRRVTTHGWLCGPGGSYRRFRKSTDRKVVGDQEREAQNFVCQNGVADPVTQWLAVMYEERARRGLRFKMLASIYDSLMLEVPEAEIEATADLVKEVLSTKVPYQPCDLDGRPVLGRGPFFFAADVSVGRRWEDWLKPDEWREIGRRAKAATDMVNI